ncbi:uncharacterized protein LY89DRAFT_689119 [Mollisia scopiformis]|uniref:WSC domain-containing protein n=1 Tax=Mollisia scopiformis TaxID=149040 RepID=A0A194WUD5_MOLSC|nr:uncharacterized protein LY89DRAFT_689119 [Mollisia scopiformis]KUJ11222.1 hypothetical protein LY89DRAFT_689119 [Mollisia scopiformis]
MYTTSTLSSLALLASAATATWTYGGCMNLAHFEENISPRYVDTLDSPFMSSGLCLETCTTPYAGIDNTTCYCGTAPFPTLDRSLDSMCDTPCPGYAMDTCGGASEFGWVSMYTQSANSSSSSSSSASSIASSSSTTATLPYTTSIIYTTELETITSCAATVTNCPARTSTTVYSVGTTVIPCSTSAATIVSSVPTSTGSNSTVKATLSPTATPSVVTTSSASVVGSWGSVVLFVVAGVVALL